MILFGINDYVWRLLEVKCGWEPINGIRPMLPAQEQPEIKNSSKPYILYGSSTDFNNGRLESMDDDVIVYLVFAETSEEADDATEVIKNAFKAFESARNITDWIYKSPTVSEKDVHVVTYTEVMDRETSGIIAEEGGKAMSTVTVRVGYKTPPEDFSLDLPPVTP